MYDLNHVAIIGNIGKKEHHSIVMNGDNQVKTLFFKIAYSSKILNKDPETKDTNKYVMHEPDWASGPVPKEDTQWIPVIAHGKLAQFLAKPTGLQTGMKVCVEGRIRMHSPESKAVEGQKVHPQVQIIARNVNLLSKRDFSYLD